MKGGVKKIWESFALEYYVPLVLLCVAAFVVLLFFSKRRKFNLMWLLQIHAGASMFQFIFVYAKLFIFKDNSSSYISYSILSFVFIEASIIYFYFSSFFKSASQRVLMKYLFIFYFLFSILILNSVAIKRAVLYISVAECLFVIIVCLIFFYNLLYFANPKPLFKIPAFWVAIGNLFVTCVVTPFTVIQNATLSPSFYLQIAINLITYISYILLFSLYIIAYLCAPKIQNSLRS